MQPTPIHHDKHRDGISIEDRWKARGGRQGKRYLAKVRDTRLQKYRRKAFPDLEAAKRWAKHTRAQLELGETSAGTWPVSLVLEDCLTVMRQEGRSPTYIHEVERHVGMMQAAQLHDLADDALHARIRQYLDLPTCENRRRRESAAPAPGTKQQRLRFVRILVNHATRYMGLRQDPMVGFFIPGVRGRITKPSDMETYHPAEVRAVLDLNRRDDPAWLAFVISVYSGLRAAELMALRWEEIDWDTRILRVARGKGGKMRHVHLQPDLFDLLYVVGGPGAEKPKLGKVLVLNYGRLQVFILRPLLALAHVKWDRGIDEETKYRRTLTWHACRRTCAAASLAAGVDSLDIQRSLGHADIEMTGEYAGAFARWKAFAQAENWPRGRLCFFAPPAALVATGIVR